jgi:DNA (cytosine-5)-methyltransferase 1
VRVLDLYCCQGGAAAGYQAAGFHVTGIDMSPQPRYCGDCFQRDDAVEFVRLRIDRIRSDFDFIHASPPCQHDSDCQRIMGREHPDLIGRTRAVLEHTGLPYVIENVRGARVKLRDPAMLCGAMFGLETYRHRYFETGGGFSFQAPEHPAHTAPQTKMGRTIRPGEFGQFIGNFSGVDHARKVMSVPWMNRDGIRECIPPAYTEWIGRRFLEHLAAKGAA